MDTKEKYWRNSLITFIIVLGCILFFEFLPMLAGLLGAFTIYMLVRHQMFFFTEKKKINKSLVAILLLIEVILCIIIPTFLLIWLLLNKMQDIEINPTAWIASAQDLINFLEQKIGYNLLETENIQSVTSYVAKGIQLILGEISTFVMNGVVLLFILYFMLINGRNMEAYLKALLPFSEQNKKSILKEIHLVTISNAIGVPLLAITQGIVAVIGYLIFGAPNVLLFGLLTCFATVIPLVGTAIVWLPLCLYFAATGNWFSAIGLAIYSLLVLTNVDNAARFILQKKMADTHPMITVFGVIIGLSLFGFWGIIFGPLMLSIFILCIDIFKREYIDGEKKINLEK